MKKIMLALLVLVFVMPICSHALTFSGTIESYSDSGGTKVSKVRDKVIGYVVYEEEGILILKMGCYEQYILLLTSINDKLINGHGRFLLFKGPLDVRWYEFSIMMYGTLNKVTIVVTNSNGDYDILTLKVVERR